MSKHLKCCEFYSPMSICWPRVNVRYLEDFAPQLPTALMEDCEYLLNRKRSNKLYKILIIIITTFLSSSKTRTQSTEQDKSSSQNLAIGFLPTPTILTKLAIYCFKGYQSLYSDSTQCAYSFEYNHDSISTTVRDVQRDDNFNHF